MTKFYTLIPIIYLTSSKLMYFALWHPPDVVIWRVSGLLHEEQGDPLEQLVTRHGSHGQVEEQAVQHRDWDIIERAECENASCKSDVN